MDAYMYQADLYCDDCGKAIREKLTREGKAPADPDNEHSYDSGKFPKGPYPDGGGEADSPCHCANCSIFLENPLTHEGCEYVADLIVEHFASGRGSKEVIEEWIGFYGITIEDLLGREKAESD